jgi:hypothetical protein
MMSKIERLSADAISKMNPVAARLKLAAEESERTAREARARVRRQRMTSEQSFKAVTAAPASKEPLEMPDSWRDDEPTAKTVLPDDRKFEKK